MFRKCDVSNWNDVLQLFQSTWKTFGVIHSVLSNAGVNSHDNFLEDEFSHDDGAEGGEGGMILQPPDLTSININLIGQIYVVKCALHYFKKWPETKCQIVMTASAGAFFPAPPIHYYCAAKAGVLSFMRSLRYEVVKKNATINVVAPWLTGK